MKTFFKVIGGILGLLVLLIIGVVAFLKFALPKVDPAPNITVKATPELLERGKYLANHVTVCLDCHGTRDWSRFAGPVIPGTEGKGGEYFGPEFGFPGKFFSRNITPAGVGNWTDGELFRAITVGVNKHNEALFPVMPYDLYRKMDQEDVKAIIAYIRTLEPIENSIPQREIDFPMNLILNTIPKDYQAIRKPREDDEVRYGEYLANIGGCIFCHTRSEKGEFIAGTEFGGGQPFDIGGGRTIRSANITSHESGIGSWTLDMFIQRFKHYENPEALYKLGDPNKEFNTIMPWGMYAGMTNKDLTAIYKYLKTVTPIENQVVKFTASAE